MRKHPQKKLIGKTREPRNRQLTISAHEVLNAKDVNIVAKPLHEPGDEFVAAVDAVRAVMKAKSLNSVLELYTEGEPAVVIIQTMTIDEAEKLGVVIVGDP